jgi:hypothetical protein
LDASLFFGSWSAAIDQFSIGQKQAGLRLASTLRPLTAFISHSFGQRLLHDRKQFGRFLFFPLSPYRSDVENVTGNGYI